MPPLPSLAGLSLNTESVTSIDYDDPNMNDTNMPDTAEFNTLILQNHAYSDAFGIDVRVNSSRYNYFRARRALLFNNMMEAVLKQVVFVVNPPNPRLFILDSPRDSAISLNDSFPATAMAVQRISDGAYNVAYKVNVKTLRFLDPSDRLRLQALTGDVNHVVLRRSKLFSSGVNMKRILTELVIQARMSELGIGPRMYLAWCMPKVSGPVLPSQEELSRLVNRPASDVILNVCTVSELFEGDLDSAFKDENNFLNKDVTDKTENRSHGFWKAVGECIVRACKHGALHFDLKGKNMLRRRKFTALPNQNIYEYEVRYTDFDPGFFTILNMQKFDVKNMELCFGMVSLYQLLASNRCLYEREPFSDSMGNLVFVPWDTVNEMAKEAFLEAYKAEYGVPAMDDIKDMCLFSRAFDHRHSPTLAALAGHLAVRIENWTNNYLVRNNCINLERGLDFREIATRIVSFAHSGTPAMRPSSPPRAVPGGSRTQPDNGWPVRSRSRR